MCWFGTQTLDAEAYKPKCLQHPSCILCKQVFCNEIPSEPSFRPNCPNIWSFPRSFLYKFYTLWFCSVGASTLRILLLKEGIPSHMEEETPNCLLLTLLLRNWAHRVKMTEIEHTGMDFLPQPQKTPCISKFKHADRKAGEAQILLPSVFYTAVCKKKRKRMSAVGVTQPVWAGNEHDVISLLRMSIRHSSRKETKTQVVQTLPPGIKIDVVCVLHHLTDAGPHNIPPG